MLINCHGCKSNICFLYKNLLLEIEDYPLPLPPPLSTPPPKKKKNSKTHWEVLLGRGLIAYDW